MGPQQFQVAPGVHLSYSVPQPPPSNSHDIERKDSHKSNSRKINTAPHRISLPRRVSVVTTEGNLVTGSIAGELKITQPRKKLILCFDGTGNKFKGNSGDTNILKIFRMLDRSGGEKCKFTFDEGFEGLLIDGFKATVHYYQRTTPKSHCIRSGKY